MEDLYNKLIDLYTLLRDEMREKWNRDLPFQELIFDRWTRAKDLKFGDGTSVYQSSFIFGDVIVGENTWIGPYTILDGSARLSIGDYCSISAGVHIYTHDTVKWALSGGKAEYEKAAVHIGNCCYIGAQTIIAKGVTIGDHCVIGANSFVNRDLPPYSIAYGSPCRRRGIVEFMETGSIDFIFDRSKNNNQ